MRTFILRARKTNMQKGVMTRVGGSEHPEIIAHAILNAFFVSQGFREDVCFYLVLDSSNDFPRTLCFSGNQGLSFSGFHEQAILARIEQVLKESSLLKKDQRMPIGDGIDIFGFGFERLVASLRETNPIYLLNPKGSIIEDSPLAQNPVFILSDHLPLPPKICKSLKRQGFNLLSLGKKMLFASQCISIIHYELDKGSI